jgi:hypothetical protein
MDRQRLTVPSWQAVSWEGDDAIERSSLPTAGRM